MVSFSSKLAAGNDTNSGQDESCLFTKQSFVNIMYLEFVSGQLNVGSK